MSRARQRSQNRLTAPNPTPLQPDSLKIELQPDPLKIEIVGMPQTVSPIVPTTTAISPPSRFQIELVGGASATPVPVQLPTLQLEIVRLPQSAGLWYQTLASLVLLLLIVLTFLLALWLLKYRILPRSHASHTFIAEKQLSISLAHPQYVAYGDENELEVTITNCASVPSSGKFALVLFTASQPAFDVRPWPDQQLGLDFQELPPGASYTRRLLFGFPEHAPQDQQINVAVVTERSRRHVLNMVPLRISGWPYQRIIVNKFFSTTILAALLALVWQLVARRLFGIEGK